MIAWPLLTVLTSADVVVDYEAPPGCPTAEHFAALVAERAPRFQLAVGREGPEKLVVEIHEGPSRPVGRLRHLVGNQTRGEKEMATDRCEELVRALALTAALSLVPSPSPEVVLEKAPAVESRAPAPVAPRASFVLAAGGGFSASGHLPPGPTTGASVFVETFRPGSGDDRGWRLRWLRPDARLTFAYSRNDLLQRQGAASFSLATATLAVCPAGWQLTRRASFWLCAAGEAGVLTGVGKEVAAPRSRHLFWSAAGLLGRARWTFERVAVDLEAGARAPFPRTHFFFESPYQTIASEPLVVWTAALSLGWIAR